jgi:chromosome segregation ATPase
VLTAAQEASVQARRQAEVESQRARDLGRYVDELRADSERIASELETELDAARERVEVLGGQLEQTRAARRDALERIEELERDLAETESARARAVEDLSEMRRRVAQLREILEPPARRAPREPPPVRDEQAAATGEDVGAAAPSTE